MILDKIENLSNYVSLNKYFLEIITFLQKTDLGNLKEGKTLLVGEELFLLYNVYNTKVNKLGILEAHKKYIDLQYIIEGEEIINYEVFRKQKIYKSYNSEDDYLLYNEDNSKKIKIEKGEFVIFFPEDLHFPGNNSSSISKKVKKIVFKILVK